MKRAITAFAIFLSAAAFSSGAQAQLTNLQFRQPLNYRFPVVPPRNVYNPYRPPYDYRQRNRRAQFLPRLTGPAIVYQNGEIGIPPDPAYEPPMIAHPVVHRIGSTGGCDVQHVQVPGSRGRTSVNIWRC